MSKSYDVKIILPINDNKQYWTIIKIDILKDENEYLENIYWFDISQCQCFENCPWIRGPVEAGLVRQKIIMIMFMDFWLMYKFSSEANIYVLLSTNKIYSNTYAENLLVNK